MKKCIVAVAGRVLEKSGGYLIEAEVMPDHVHLLVDVVPSISINAIATQIKGATLYQLKQKFPHVLEKNKNIWSRDKFIVSVGSTNLDVVKSYIQNQNRVT